MDNIVTGRFSSIEQAADSFGKIKTVSRNDSTQDISFKDILDEKKSISDAAQQLYSGGEVRFSKHADMRLRQRDIKLTDEQLSRLNEGTQKAGEKGIKESLVLMDNLAFIVNTQNNTVVTAMDQSSSDENVYTNIDGAVVI